MSNFYFDNDDLRFYVEKGIKWEPLVRATENDLKVPGAHASVDEAVAFYKDILDNVGAFVAAEVAPWSDEIDREGIRLENGEAVLPERLKKIFSQIAELGLHGMCLPRELKGMNTPLLIYFMNAEMFGRGDVSVMSHHAFHGGMALAMLFFSLREGTTKIDPKTGAIETTRFREFIEEIGRGEAWGSMDITEPDAGSDMAALRARAEQDAQGNWFVTGQKIFITSGHGKFHFVVAKTGPESSLKELSMFVVPAYEDQDGKRKRHVKIGRLEEKLGHHASVTAQVEMDRAPALLVGKVGEGFEYMLTLMNGARLGVGFECLGLCESAIRKAKDYAAMRKSMGKTLDRHEMIADYLEEMTVDIAGLRALCIHGAYEEEMAQKKRTIAAHAELSPEDKTRLTTESFRHQRRARRVTPLIKYLAGEKAVEIARRAVQIHGGMGYMRETGVEKLLRDSIAMPIYEGTSQIQSLMAMKDTLGGIIKNPQRFLKREAAARVRALSGRDSLDRRVARLQALSHKAQRHLVMRVAGDKFRSTKMADWGSSMFKSWDIKRDFAFAMLHAERLTRVLADEAICERLLEQAHEFPERRELCERYLDRAEPRVRFLVEEIHTTGKRVLERLAPAARTEGVQAWQSPSAM